MISANIDVSQMEIKSMEALDVAELYKKKSLHDSEVDMLESNITSFISPMSSNQKKFQYASVLGTNNQAQNSNLMTKLQGQQWQQYFDFDKVLKQMRCTENVTLRNMEIGHHAAAGSSNNSKYSSSVSSIISSQKVKQTTQKQVKRLSGNDMQYYGLAPKQKALEIVICNICKGIYTKVGFNNHMFLQHASIWNSVPTKVYDPPQKFLVNPVSDSREGSIADIEHIEVASTSSGIIGLSSCIMSTSTSSISSSILGSSTRAVKVSRTSSTTNSLSYNGRSRCKSSRNSQLPVSLSTHIMESSLLPVTQVMLSTSSNPKSLSSVKFTNKDSTKTLTSIQSIQSNVTGNMLASFGDATGAKTNDSLTHLVVSTNGPFLHSSQSAISSSTISSVSSKATSQSKISSSPITYPTTSPPPTTDAIKNANAKFDMFSCSTPFFLGSNDKGSGNVYFCSESLKKTEENETISSNYDLRVSTSATSSKVSTQSNTDIFHTSDVDSDSQINNVRFGSATKSNAKIEEYCQILSNPPNKQIEKIDLSLTSHNISSSTPDIKQANKNPIIHDNSLNNVTTNLERLHMGTISTTKISPILTLTKSNPCVKMSTHIVTKHSSANKLNFDKICGVGDDFLTLTCTRSLTCGVHSHSQKRQVPGRTKPFDDLLENCLFEEEKDEINPIISSTSANLELRNAFATIVGVPKSSALDDATLHNKSLMFIKPTSENHITYKNLPEGSNLEVAMSFCHSNTHGSNVEKSKGKPSKFTSSTTQMPVQMSEQFSDGHAQNQISFDENSPLTLENIFDHNTHLEMLDSKFISEILNTSESDINIDGIDGLPCRYTANVNSRSNQPSIKIVRNSIKIENSTLQQKLGIEKKFCSFEPLEIQALTTENPPVSNHVIELKSNLYNKSGHDKEKKQMHIPYQMNLKQVLGKKQQGHISVIDAIQYQQLLYQSCSLHDPHGTILNKQNHQKHLDMIGNRNKEEIDFENEKKVSRENNIGKILSNVSTGNRNKRAAFCELGIDENYSEEMEWNLNVNVPSLSDNNEGVQIKSLFEFSKKSQGVTKEHGSSTETNIYSEVTTDSSAFVQQKQVFPEILAKRKIKFVADIWNNSKKMNISDQSGDLSFDINLIESTKLSRTYCRYTEQKVNIFLEQNLEQVNFNIKVFNYIPRPLAFNSFALVKLPLSLATIFRSDLSSRKTDNNLITLTGSGSSFPHGNFINGFVIGGHSINMSNATKIFSDMSIANSNGSVINNAINEFLINNAIVSIPVNNSLPKHKRNDNMVTNCLASSKSVTTSSPGIIIAHSFQKNILNNSSNSYPSVNGKSKFFVNSASPTAVINTSRLSNLGQKNQNCSTFSNSFINFARNLHTISENERIYLVKRSLITEPSTAKSFFTSRIISEVLLKSDFSIANFLGTANRNCDNLIKSYTIKHYGNKTLYTKRSILNLSQYQRGRIKKSFRHC